MTFAPLIYLALTESQPASLRRSAAADLLTSLLFPDSVSSRSVTSAPLSPSPLLLLSFFPLSLCPRYVCSHLDFAAIPCESHLLETILLWCVCVCSRVRVLSCSFGDLLSFTLTAFVELMDHGIVSWDTFSVAFIKKVSLEIVPSKWEKRAAGG